MPFPADSEASGKTPLLAIVIPAWKTAFLREAVDSILAGQGDDFHLFIGDDASAEDIPAALGGRLHDPRLTYHRFQENLGGFDLVAHWERCIDLTRDSEWIWLFSDDDIMGPGCIPLVLRAIADGPPADLYRFPVSCIDETGSVVRDFPIREFASPREFSRLRLGNEIDSFAVEYVFRRSTFVRKQRFQSFDLAWGSDDAMWMKLMEERPARLLEGCRVLWRRSRLNISSNHGSPELALRKVRARLTFLRWMGDRYPWFRDGADFRNLSRSWFFRNLELRAFASTELYRLSLDACSEMGWSGARVLAGGTVVRKLTDRLGNLLAGK
jgi:glycosyltransferase involved in cell wall biosynthesis